MNGSEKYPVKEPFVELIKGSLQTFVNAFTFPDKTSYPVASQNLQDLYNLVDVYMDAVLHPLLPTHILDQEGWHYGLDEDSGDLIYKGVVFNEMKGAMSDPNGLLEETSQNSLFPDNLYRHNSGGDPKDIPSLTFEQFKNFHQTYYHPSNSYIFWYGDDPEEARLEKMSAYLAEYDALEVDSQIPLQAPFDEAVHITEPYAVGDDEEDLKYYVASNWVLGEQTDPEETLGLSILSHILVGTSASPLRKVLIDSGYGEDLVGGGLDSNIRQLVFSTGLKGVQEENTAKVEGLIDETLRQLAEDGIDPGMVAAALNTVEFRLRENNTGAFPRGIILMLRAMSTWLYDDNPFEPLAYETPLSAIKEKAAAGAYFEDLLRKYFLKNTHRSTVILEPDPDLNRRLEEEEAARLKAVQDAMTAEELDGIAKHAAELKEIQETPDSPESLATLPVLQLSDLDKENKTIPMEILDESGIPVFYHDLFTNGIVYLDLGFDLKAVPEDLLPYLGLFAGGLVKMGTETEDFVSLSQRIGRETGGVAPSITLRDKYQANDTVSLLMVRAKSTVDQVDEMLGILKDILLTTDFDQPERFRQILVERKARMESTLIPRGHGVVNRRLKAGLSMSGWLDEQISGIENLFFSRKLLEQMESDWDAVVEKFNQIRELVVNRSGMLLNVTVDEQNWAQVRPQLGGFIEAIPASEMSAAAWTGPQAGEAEGLTIPAQVNYVGKGANLYDLGYKLNGSISVVQKYLGTTYIWEKIRVQGGAYGGFSVFDLYSGAFSFLSYRDPNVVDTLENYDNTSAFLKNLQIPETELVKSIIGTIGSMDAYQLPDAKGASSLMRYLTGYTDELRQQMREQVLATTVEDFHALAGVIEQVAQTGQVVVLGSVDAIRQANEEKEDFLNVKDVL